MEEWWSHYPISKTHREFLRSLYDFCAATNTNHLGRHWAKAREWMWDVPWGAGLTWILEKLAAISKSMSIADSS
jgi:hypothetical protein